MTTQICRTYLYRITSCFLILAICPLCGAASDLTAYRPQWTVGQTWRVEASVPGRYAMNISTGRPIYSRKMTTNFLFTVEQPVEIEGQVCHCIRIDYFLDPNQYALRFYKAFVTIGDGTLKVVKSYLVHDGQLVYSRVSSGGPIDASSVTDGLPLLPFPVFSKEAETHAPPASEADKKAVYMERRKAYTKNLRIQFLPKDPKAKIEKQPVPLSPYGVWQENSFPQESWVVNGKEKQVLKTNLIQIQSVESDPNKELSTQIWAKGLPWFLQAEYKDRIWPFSVARLTHIDGVPVTITSKPKPKPQEKDQSP